jgi:hypothetical protein
MLPSTDAGEWDNYIIIITNPFNDLPRMSLPSNKPLSVAYSFIQQKASVNL